MGGPNERVPIPRNAENGRWGKIHSLDMHSLFCKQQQYNKIHLTRVLLPCRQYYLDTLLTYIF